jgi:hypothetical protein
MNIALLAIVILSVFTLSLLGACERTAATAPYIGLSTIAAFAIAAVSTSALIYKLW